MTVSYSYLLPFPGIDDSFVDAEEVGDFSDHRRADTEELAPEVPPLVGSPVCRRVEAVVVTRGQVHRHLVVVFPRRPINIKVLLTPFILYM